jgi:FkbM family methyltransferase
MNVRNLLRKTLNLLHLDITQNLKYDRLTKAIIKKAVKPSSVCIDVGCHKGEILDLILQQAPKGGHYGFEPIPSFYSALKNKYGNKNHILHYALSDKEGMTTFQFVKNAPAYSGLKKRKYDVENPDIEEINVEVKTLDSLIPESTKIDLIKIDVEGAELGVLKGAKNVLFRNKPIVIFECGLGASDYYNTKPEEVFRILQNAGLKISLLEGWIKKKKPLTEDQFVNIFKKNIEYYFIAHP